MMGGAGSALMWPEFFLDFLVDNGFQVIRYDYRGVGLSDWMEDWSEETAYDLSDMTADVTSILDTLYIDKAHLLGVSMGGLIARQFALDHPERTASLILLSSMGLVNQPDQSFEASPPVADMLRLVLRYGFRDSEADQVRMMIGILAIMNGQSIEPLDVTMYTEQILYDLRKRRGINLAALEQHFHAIRLSGANLDTITQTALPILVVHGTQDPMIPIESVKRFTRQLQNGRGVWVEGLGHVLSEKRSEHALQAMVEHMSATHVALASMNKGNSE
jgi:pimeloyl-ACP methyl ester carboxylesterase